MKTTTYNLVNGSKSVNFINLDVDDYTVIFTYNGNNNYLNDTYEINFTVYKADPKMYYTTSENIIYGENATIEVNVTGIYNETLEGNVTFAGEGVEIKTFDLINATVAIDYEGLDAGDYNYFYYFNGNDNYDVGAWDINFTVDKAIPEISAEIVLNGDEAIIVIIAPEGAIGNFTVDVDDVTYNATTIYDFIIMMVENLTKGVHNFTVNYW